MGRVLHDGRHVLVHTGQAPHGTLVDHHVVADPHLPVGEERGQVGAFLRVVGVDQEQGAAASVQVVANGFLLVAHQVGPGSRHHEDAAVRRDFHLAEQRETPDDVALVLEQLEQPVVAGLVGQVDVMFAVAFQEVDGLLAFPRDLDQRVGHVRFEVAVDVLGLALAFEHDRSVGGDVVLAGDAGFEIGVYEFVGDVVRMILELVQHVVDLVLLHGFGPAGSEESHNVDVLVQLFQHADGQVREAEPLVGGRVVPLGVPRADQVHEGQDADHQQDQGRGVGAVPRGAPPQQVPHRLPLQDQPGRSERQAGQQDDQDRARCRRVRCVEVPADQDQDEPQVSGG